MGENNCLEMTRRWVPSALLICSALISSFLLIFASLTGSSTTGRAATPGSPETFHLFGPPGVEEVLGDDEDDEEEDPLSCPTQPLPETISLAPKPAPKPPTVPKAAPPPKPTTKAAPKPMTKKPTPKAAPPPTMKPKQAASATPQPKAAQPQKPKNPFEATEARFGSSARVGLSRRGHIAASNAPVARTANQPNETGEHVVSNFRLASTRSFL